MRPLGIAALEDKIVQRALVEVLNTVYENDFLGFSYGFRPKRNQHQALDAVVMGITRTNVSWIVDADIKSFFDTVNHAWLIKFVEHRIGDPRPRPSEATANHREFWARNRNRFYPPLAFLIPPSSPYCLLQPAAKDIFARPAS